MNYDTINSPFAIIRNFDSNIMKKSDRGRRYAKYLLVAGTGGKYRCEVSYLSRKRRSTPPVITLSE